MRLSLSFNVNVPLDVIYCIFTGRNKVVAKVIFLHLSVIHSVHRGGGVYLVWSWGVSARYTPRDQVHPLPPDQVHPPRPGTPPGPGAPPPRPGTPWTRYTPLGPGTPPRPGTPSGTRYLPLPRPGTPPQTRYTPQPGTPPRTRYTPRDQVHPKYGQRVAGTHPTGMHSCIGCR